MLSVDFEELFFAPDVRDEIIGRRKPPTGFPVDHREVLEVVIGIEEADVDHHLFEEQIHVNPGVGRHPPHDLCKIRIGDEVREVVNGKE